VEKTGSEAGVGEKEDRTAWMGSIRGSGTWGEAGGGSPGDLEQEYRALRRVRPQGQAACMKDGPSQSNDNISGHKDLQRAGGCRLATGRRK